MNLTFWKAGARYKSVDQISFRSYTMKHRSSRACVRKIMPDANLPFVIQWNIAMVKFSEPVLQIM